MSRDRADSSYVQYTMRCDQEGCTTRSEIAPTISMLPLKRFRDEGWFIAQHYGDACPACVAKWLHLGIAPMPDNQIEIPLEEHEKTYSDTIGDVGAFVPAYGQG